MTDDLQLVRDELTGDYGVHYPDRDIVETYDGDERRERQPGPNWQPVGQDELRAHLEAEIAAVRADIESVREADLTDEQAAEVDRLESRVESYEKALDLVREVNEADA